MVFFRKIRTITGLTLILIATICAKNDNIEFADPHFGISSQFGQLMKYKLRGGKESTHQWQKRFGGVLELGAIYKKNTFMSAGIFGGYFNVLPEKDDPGFVGSNWTRSGAGISHGYIQNKFGVGEEGNRGSIQFGRFNYKYNSNASNLGEYLFRSHSYPTTVLTGGILPVYYSASSILDGIKFSYKTGPVDHDILFTSETTFNPFFDFSLSYLPTLKLGEVVQLGFGVQLDKLISVKEKRTTNEISKNSYVESPQVVSYTWVNSQGDSIVENVSMTHFVGDDEYYRLEKTFYNRLRDFEDSLMINPAKRIEYGRMEDSLTLVGLRDTYAKQAGLYSSLETIGFGLKNNDSIPKNYFTFRSVKFMGMLAVDFYPLLGSSQIFGERDLKIFAEAVVLGVKDYPIFYTDLKNRLPIMFGFSLPCFANLFKNIMGFSILDYAELQFEYFRNDYPVSTMGIGRGIAVPDQKANQGEDVFGEFYGADLYKEDDWKFSLLLGKKLSDVLEIRMMIARDHFISFNQDFFYGRGMEPQDILLKKDHWYWMTDITFGF